MTTDELSDEIDRLHDLADRARTDAMVIRATTVSACRSLRCEPGELAGEIRALFGRLGRAEHAREVAESRMHAQADRLSWIPAKSVAVIVADEWAMAGSVLVHGRPAFEICWHPDGPDFLCFEPAEFWAETVEYMQTGQTYPFSTAVGLSALPHVVARHRAMLRVLGEMRALTESLRRLTSDS